MKQEIKDIAYVPVNMFIRISKREGEPERALLVARRENGKEFIFSYETEQGEFDLTVCDFVNKK